MKAIPLNKFSAGPLVLANSDNGVAIFTGYDLEPGEVRVGRVTICNTGSRAGVFELFEVHPSNGFGPGELTMTVREGSGENPIILYEGDPGGIAQSGINLGDFSPGEARTYYFTVKLDEGASNSSKDRGAGAAYEWRVAASTG